MSKKRKNKRHTQTVSDQCKTNDTVTSSGASLAHILPAAQYQKSRFLYILLALVMPGAGLNNYYAGYKKRAIIQTLCLFPGIFFFGIPAIISIGMTYYDVFAVKKDSRGLTFK